MTKNTLEQIKTVNQLDKLLRGEGYTSRSTGGSHIIYSAKGKPSVSVPQHKGDIAPGTIRNIKKVLLGESYYTK